MLPVQVTGEPPSLELASAASTFLLNARHLEYVPVLGDLPAVVGSLPRRRALAQLHLHHLGHLAMQLALGAQRDFGAEKGEPLNDFVVNVHAVKVLHAVGVGSGRNGSLERPGQQQSLGAVGR